METQQTTVEQQAPGAPDVLREVRELVEKGSELRRLTRLRLERARSLIQRARQLRHQDANDRA